MASTSYLCASCFPFSKPTICLIIPSFLMQHLTLNPINRPNPTLHVRFLHFFIYTFWSDFPLQFLILIRFNTLLCSAQIIWSDSIHYLTVPTGTCTYITLHNRFPFLVISSDVPVVTRSASTYDMRCLCANAISLSRRTMHYVHNNWRTVQPHSRYSALVAPKLNWLSFRFRLTPTFLKSSPIGASLPDVYAFVRATSWARESAEVNILEIQCIRWTERIYKRSSETYHCEDKNSDYASNNGANHAMRNCNTGVWRAWGWSRIGESRGWRWHGLRGWTVLREVGSILIDL